MSQAHRADLVATELVAVVMCVHRDQPLVLTVGSPTGVAALPSGPLRSSHRSLQAGMRAWVRQLTGHELGFVEQLYTFADRERIGAHQRVISVSYLGLAAGLDPDTLGAAAPQSAWRPLYEFFPAEDRRDDPQGLRAQAMIQALGSWSQTSEPMQSLRQERVRAAYGTGGQWSAQLALARYELAWEAHLVAESHGASRVGAPAATTGPNWALLPPVESLARAGEQAPAGQVPAEELPTHSGAPMLHDHRRILATGLSRLRATIQYRPVVFEAMPATFTLRELQLCVEAISGVRLHTQNFRRLVLGQDLVEPMPGHYSSTGGRPARVFRYRREGLRDGGVEAGRVDAGDVEAGGIQAGGIQAGGQPESP